MGFIVELPGLWSEKWGVSCVGAANHSVGHPSSNQMHVEGLDVLVAPLDK
jgi:hypothetical protein